MVSGKEVNASANNIDLHHPAQSAQADTFNPVPNNPLFLRVYGTSLSKTLWEMEKLLVMSNFSFFHSVFYPLEEPSPIFIKFEIVVFCKLFQFGRV